ncbi:hypothetical protein [Halorubrum sp. Boch-26]|uniref:hypothetical protein n=1 Tax=Halorubrum sp. Boch-26 TaxID=2994426 RepID=UPI0024696643|nr:hypothetical protein [Halorubrum sp. Boch-26]
MFRLLLIGVLWLGLISLVSYAAFRYVDNRQRLEHEKEMQAQQYEHEERQALFDEDD